MAPSSTDGWNPHASVPPFSNSDEDREWDKDGGQEARHLGWEQGPERAEGALGQTPPRCSRQPEIGGVAGRVDGG